MSYQDPFLQDDNRSPALQVAEAETKLGMMMLEKPSIIPLPVNAFPDRIQAMMHGYHNVYGSSYEHFGLSMLTTIATAIGNSLQIKHQSCHPPVLFAALIAPPGSGKSPIIKTCIDPILTIARERIDQFKQQLADYREQLKRAKEEADDLEQPQPERPLVTNFTIEILYKRLLSTPNGILVYRDELRGWLNSMNQYKSSGDEYEFWLQAHDALPFSVDRKNETLPLFINRVMLNILGGIQPGVLKAIATKENQDSGMLSRMIFAWPDTQQVRDYNDDEPDPDYADRWERIVKAAYAIRPRLLTLDDGVQREVPETITLTAAAKQHYEVYYNALQQRYRDADDETQMSTISKFRTRSLRLALILHAFEWAVNMVEQNLDPTTPPDDFSRATLSYDDEMAKVYHPVSGDTMARALLLARHYEDANMRVVTQTENPAEALPPHEKAWYYSLPEEGSRGDAIDLGLKAGMKQRTIDRRLKGRKDLFKYGAGRYEKII